MTPNDFRPKLHVPAHQRRLMDERAVRHATPMGPREAAFHLTLEGVALAIVGSLGLWAAITYLYVWLF